ncbi:MAG TPA: hypothetical protein PK299_12395 [Anaerolineales bacterium]|nr:hypothetical protein [Anaerolineales bacterium]
MSRAQNLYKLQQIDSELDHCLHRLAEIVKLLADDTTIQAAVQKFEQAEQVTKQARLAKSRLDDELQRTQDKRASSEQKLYGGTVKNPKELKDLQDLGVALSKQIAHLEEQQLEAMIVLEEQEALEKAAQAALQMARNQKATQTATLTAEQATLREQGLGLKKKRAVAETPISAEDRTRYAELRKAKRGVAVSLTQDATCTACGIGMSTVRATQARTSADLVLCGNCGRILYVP